MASHANCDSEPSGTTQSNAHAESSGETLCFGAAKASKRPREGMHCDEQSLPSLDYALPRAHRVSWAPGVESPAHNREEWHKQARTRSMPISPWSERIRVVRLRLAGTVSLDHTLDWAAITDVFSELNAPLNRTRRGPEALRAHPRVSTG